MPTSPRGSEAVRSPSETIACSRGYRLEQRPSAGADARAQGTGGLGLGLSEMGDTQKGHGANLPHVLPAASPPRASLCLAPCSPIPFTCRPFSRALLCGSPGSAGHRRKDGLDPLPRQSWGPPSSLSPSTSLPGSPPVPLRPGGPGRGSARSCQHPDRQQSPGESAEHRGAGASPTWLPRPALPLIDWI